MNYIMIYAPVCASQYKDRESLRTALCRAVVDGDGGESAVVFVGDTRTIFFEELFGICSALSVPISNISTERNLSSFCARLVNEPDSKIYCIWFMTSKLSDYTADDMKLYSWSLFIDGYGNTIRENEGLDDYREGARVSLDDSLEKEISNAEERILQKVKDEEMISSFQIQPDFETQIRDYLERVAQAKVL